MLKVNKRNEGAAKPCRSTHTHTHTHTHNVNINTDEIIRGFYALAYLNKTKKKYIKPVVI